MKSFLQLFLKGTLGFLASFFFVLSVDAAPTASASLSGLLNNISTLQADFTQTIYDNHQKAIQQSTGKMALERPGKFRWDVQQPIPQLIIANGERLWIYDPDLEQVTIRALDKAAGQTPGLLLSNSNATLDSNFTIKEIIKSGFGSDWRWFALAPKKSDAMFETMQLGFQKGQISQMQLTDNLGHTTTIQYQNSKVNAKLASSLFVFNPPANIDVIDETRPKPTKKH